MDLIGLIGMVTIVIVIIFFICTICAFTTDDDPEYFAVILWLFIIIGLICALFMLIDAYFISCYY